MHDEEVIDGLLDKIEALKAERDAMRKLFDFTFAEWHDKHIHSCDVETYQNWAIKIYLPVPLSETDKSPEAALIRAIDAAREVKP